GRGACGSLAHLFFQAEDGIRDFHVTGVQTCAIPYRGVVVAEPSVDEVADLCVVRDVLEELAARLAAQSVSEVELMALEQVQAEFEAAAARGDVEKMVEENIAFHEAIWRASRNR